MKYRSLLLSLFFVMFLVGCSEESENKENQNFLPSTEVTTKILPGAPTEYGSFGESLSMDGDYIVVAEQSRNLFYLYKKMGYGEVSLVKMIQAENDNDFFGTVSLSGNYIAVDTFQQDSTKKVVLYKIGEDDSVTRLSTFQPDDQNCSLISSRSLNGEYMAVKTDTDLYLLKNISDTNISQVATIAIDNNISDLRDLSFDMYGDYFVLGIPYASENGMVNLYQKHSDDNVTLITSLHGDTDRINDAYGYAVSMNEDYIIIGAPGKLNVHGETGEVYVYERPSGNSVNRISILPYPFLQNQTNFGEAVAINGYYLAVAVATEYRCIYLYRIDATRTVSLVETLEPFDLEAQEWLGSHIEMDYETIVFSAPTKSTYTNYDGAVYVYYR